MYYYKKFWIAARKSLDYIEKYCGKMGMLREFIKTITNMGKLQLVRSVNYINTVKLCGMILINFLKK